MKVLLVDDEIFTIRMLQNVIPWKEMGLELIGYSQNGEDAYEKVVEGNPDIIISDIRMPGTDGLTFLKKVHNYNPGIKSILMSAYADFSYVKEGMKQGCSDYILKPIDESELEQALRKVILAIQGEKAQEKVISKSMQQLDSLNLYQYMRTGQGKNRALKSWQTCNIYSYRVFIVQINNTTIDEYNNFANMEIGHEEYITNILEQTVLDTAHECMIFDYEEGCWTIIIKDGSDIKCDETAGKMIEDMQAKMGIHLNICFSSPGHVLDELPELYEEVRSLSKYSFYIGEEDILGFGYNCNKGELDEIRDIGIVKDMEQAVKSGNREEAVSILNEVLEYPVGHYPERLNYIYEFCYQVVLLVRKYISDVSEITYNELSSIGSLKELKAKMMDVIAYIPCGRADEPAEEVYSKPVKSSIKLIQNNYSRNLSLEEICTEISISKNYFCYLFKRETGMSLWNYLTMVRLQHAKELLDGTELRSYEIAFQVGYDNPSYFSRIFKKYENMTPSEYRERKK